MSEDKEFFEYIQKNRRRSLWQKFVRAMACIVVFCTTYALILPGITMESEIWCGYEEHIHEELCFKQLDTATDAQLTCELGDFGVHVHTDDCRDASGVLVCGFADYVIHTHNDFCYDASGNQICTLREVTAHIHSDACYRIPESETHSHSEACYEVTRGEQICTLEEKTGHAHDKACYGAEGTLICGQEEHAAYSHSEACYTVETVTTCGLETHPHTDACFTPKTLSCTEEEHSHGDSCYGKPVLICEAGEHTHGEGCYTDGELSCGEESHTHGSGCYAEAELVCGKSVHAHGDGCYTAPVQICGMESHPHTDACYTEIKTLVCERTETEGHTHCDSCYEYPLICTLTVEEGHQHSDDCFERIETLICGEDSTTAATEVLEPVLSCGMDEIDVHTHSESCLDESGNWACGLLEIQEHTHTEACVAEAQEQPLTCTLEESEEHQHNELCYGTWGYDCGMEEHSHTLACFSNPEADVETAEVWNQMLAGVELTGSFADDLAAIAKTQLGYTESEKNYQVLEDGETMKGYTRYGAWAGTPYADWNALFVAFCVNYAEIPGEVFPTAETPEQWAALLADSYYDLYYAADSGYLPKTGDVAFLHVPESENETEAEKKIPNFMGIILECTDTELTIAAGDSDNMVEKVKISLSDSSLLGYGEVFAMPMLGVTLEGNPYDLGAIVTVNCLNSQNQSTDTYAGLEPFELRISYHTEMTASQTYTLTLAENFVAKTVEKIWGDCTFTYSNDTRTITFSPANTQTYGGELSIKGKIASHTSDQEATVYPVSGNSKTVTITQNPQPLSYTASNGQFTVNVDLLDPKTPNSIYKKVAGIKLTPVQPNETLYQAMTNGESGTLNNTRVYDRKMFTVQFVDAEGIVVTGLDLSSRNITLTVTGMDSLKGVGDADTVTRAFYKSGNAVNEMVSSQENAYVYEISGSALTDNAFILDFVSTNPEELAEGTYGDARFAYNDMRDAFIHDPTYAEFYNADSPLGTAGSFHLVGFGDVYTNAHTNGNILAYNLYAYNNFGSNTKDSYEDFRELHYVQNYKVINATSSARNEDVLVLGSNHTIGVVNGNEFTIDTNKIGKPKNLVQDDDTNTDPFIDLHRVESEIRAISANLGSYLDIDIETEFIIANEPNENGKYGPKTEDLKEQHTEENPYLKIMNKDNIGVWNATPREIQALAGRERGLAMKGFESDGSGAIIVNVDMSTWPADQVLELPVSRVYVDGKAEDVTETLDFSAGKVIWNFTNADGKQIKTDIMTGMVVAPGATVTISQNLNGTVVAENIDVRAESHRTDFVGKIYKNEFLTSAHIHVHKVDKENYGHLLAGAEFKIYEYTANGYEEASVKVTDADSSQQAEQSTGVTGTNGVILFDELKYNTVYKLVETKAPAGYQLDSTERYLYFAKTGEGVTQGPKPGDFADMSFINTTADGDCVHYHFTNTERDVEKTSISVKKIWDLGTNGPDEVPVDLVYFDVYQTATTQAGKGEPTWYGMYPVTKDGNWQTTIVNLPKTSLDGTTTYSYSVREVSVPGFITTYENNEGVFDPAETIQIINTVNDVAYFHPITVSKKWLNNDNTAPEISEIKFSIYRTTSVNPDRSDPSTPVLIGQETLSAANNWTWISENLPYQYIDSTTQKTMFCDYYVEEIPVEGYTATYEKEYKWSDSDENEERYVVQISLDISNTKDPTASISLEKKWYDEKMDESGNPKEIPAPVNEITVQLQRMTRFMNDWENYGEPITVTKDQSWQHTVTELPMYDSVINADGTRNPYYYRFVETEVDGFDAAYTIIHPQNPGYAVNEEIDGIGNGGKIVISNTKRETTSLKINKIWKNPAGDLLTDIDTESITVRIYRQLSDDATTKQEYKVVTITPDENKNWVCTVGDLPKTDANGAAYQYSVEEDAVPGYVTTYSLGEENGVPVHQITNQARTGYTTIQVEKQWAMLDGSTTPPEDATVTFDLIQRSAPRGWTGETYLDTSKVDPVTVQYTFNGTTHSLIGYPGETVNLVMCWNKVNEWDDIQYANPNASISWLHDWTQSLALEFQKSNTTATSAEFTMSFTIRNDVQKSSDGKYYITINTNVGSWDQWTLEDLQLIPTARETVLGTYSLPNEDAAAQGQRWKFKRIGLPATQEIGGSTIDYTYFVEEHTVPGYTTSYTNNGGITGGTITITNTERQNKTYLSIHKEWVGVTDQSALPESIQVDVWQIAVPEGQSIGDPGIDISADPVTVQFSLQNKTYTVQGYPGQEVGFESIWTRQSSTDDLQYAKIGDKVTYSWTSNTGAVYSTADVSRTVISQDKVICTFKFTIPADVVTSNGEKTISVTTTENSFSANHWTAVPLEVVRYAKYNSYTLSAAQDWNLVLNELPLLYEDSSGKITNYSYFVDEIAVPGFTVSYAGNDTKHGVTNAEVTITNTEKDNKTSITVSKKWTNGVEDVTDNAVNPIQFYLYQVANNPAEEETAITVTNSLPNPQTNQLTAKPGDTVKITLSWTATEDSSTDMNGFDPELQYCLQDTHWTKQQLTTDADVDGRNAVFTAELTINEMMSSGATIECGNARVYYNMTGGTWTSNIELLEASSYSGPHTLQPSAWSMTFDSLPKEAEDEDGNIITYSYYVKEVNGEQYNVTYTDAGGNAVSSDAPVQSGTVTITNTDETITMPLTVTKKWFNSDGSSFTKGTGEVKFNLHQIASTTTGGSAGKVTVSYYILKHTNGQDKWKYSPEPQEYDKGTILTIRLICTWGAQPPTLENATYSKYQGEAPRTFEYKIGPLTKDITISGCLEDWNADTCWTWGETTIDRSGVVTIPSETTREDTIYKANQILNNSNNWTAEYKGLPLEDTDDSGNKVMYTYYVEEIAVEGYETSYEGNDTTNGVTSGTILIKNTEVSEGGYELPSTGSIGTMPYTLGGLAMLLCGAVLFLLKRRQIL